MLELKNILAPFVAALWQGRWLAMTIAWLACLVGWIGVALLPNVYTATARMYVDTDTLLRPLMKDLAVSPDFDLQVAIMRDTFFAVPNIEELMLRTGIGAEIDDPVEHANLIEDFGNKLYLDLLGRNLFEIGYRHHDPDKAFQVVSVMLDIFVQQQLGHSQRDVEIAGAFIDEQIVAYDAKLREAELRVAEYQKEHGEELGGAERNVRDLDQTDAETRRLRSELEAANWRRDQIRTKLDSVPKTVSSGEAGASPAQEQLRELNGELTRKLLLYTEQHPDILALRQLIAQANEQVKAESEGERIADFLVPNPAFDQLNSQLQTVEIQIDDLTRRLSVAENERQALSDKVRLAPQVEADLKRLNRDYDVLLNQYEKLIQKRESAQLARELDEGKKRIEFRTVEPPVRPVEPSGPPHGLFMLVVLMLGGGVGGAFVIGRFLLSDTVLTSAQLQSQFPSLPVMGGVSEVLPGKHGRASSLVGLTGSVAALLVVFVTFFYFYQISPQKPDLAEIAINLAESVVGKHAKADP